MNLNALWAVVAAVVQVSVMVALAPVLIGVSRQARAKLEGRVGAGIWQPWRDLRKLLRKEPVVATSSSWMLPLAPVVVLGSGGLVCALLPLIGARTVPGVPADLFVVVSVLLFGSVAMALLGLDAGTAFGGMGASRHMMIAALVEPTVLLAVYALSIPVGSSSLSLIVAGRLENPAQIASPVGFLAVGALIIAVIAETGRLPVDNPATHLELTMIHEAMILEVSGRDLAWLELGAWLRLGGLLGLVANLVAPWGLATGGTPQENVSATVLAGVAGLVVGVLALVAKLLALAVVLGAGEVFLAKVRLFKVPELLAGSFALAFLAVTAGYLVG